MEESKNKERNNQEFLGKKRELPETKLELLSDDEKNEIKIAKKNYDNIPLNIDQKENICKICGIIKDKILKFENINEIKNYLKNEKIDINYDIEFEENKNIMFNTNKIICSECFQNIIKDKNKFDDFFISSIEIINDDSDENSNININEDKKSDIIIYEIENDKNENEPNKNEEKQHEEKKQINKEINLVENKEINKNENIDIKNNENKKNEENKIEDNNKNIENIKNDKDNKVDNTENNMEQINPFMNVNENIDNGGNINQNLQNLILLNAYLSNINMINQNIESEQNNTINKKNDQTDNDNINKDYNKSNESPRTTKSSYE